MAAHGYLLTRAFLSRLVLDGMFAIRGRPIGPGHPTYIVAEMSANHLQSYDRAVRIVHAAAAAGADAVKLQTYTADTITLACDKPWFRVQGTVWDSRILHDLYREACTPWDWHPRLQAEAQELGLDLFSSPFDDTAVDFLESLDVPCHKIASFELVDLPLIRKVAATGRPLIMSTGMATLEEIEEAVRTFRAAGGGDLALLKCTSAYPAAPEQMHLRTLPHLAATFDVPVGLSDHTPGATVAIAAVTLGACIVEKHLTLSRADGGPDGSFSMEPAEFGAMVAEIRRVEQALGSVHYGPTGEEAQSRAFRRSLFAVQDIRAGEPLTLGNIRSIRPACGLHTRHLPDLLGRPAATDIPRGTPLSWDHVERGAQLTGC